jgi:hypothetical protein
VGCEPDDAVGVVGLASKDDCSICLSFETPRKVRSSSG